MSTQMDLSVEVPKIVGAVLIGFVIYDAIYTPLPFKADEDIAPILGLGPAVIKDTVQVAFATFTLLFTLATIRAIDGYFGARASDRQSDPGVRRLDGFQAVLLVGLAGTLSVWVLMMHGIKPFYCMLLGFGCLAFHAWELRKERKE